MTDEPTPSVQDQLESGDASATIAPKPKRTKEQMTQLTLEGMLPFFSRGMFEMANPVLRSAIFVAGRLPSKTSAKMEPNVPIFSVGGAKVVRHGYKLCTDHEMVWARLLANARGKSITQAIQTTSGQFLSSMGLSDGGKNFEKLQRILHELANTSIEITSRPAVQHIRDILKDESLIERKDGKFLVDYLKNVKGDLLALVEEAVAAGDDEVIAIRLKLIDSVTTNPRTGRLSINLDPLTCLFFDGVSTTLLPFDILESITNRLARKILGFAASHKAGAFRMSLRAYHGLSGLESNYEVSYRTFKMRFMEACTELENKELIAPGWIVVQNKEGEWMVDGIVVTDKISLSTHLESEKEPISTVPELLPNDEHLAQEKSQRELAQPRLI